MNPEKEAYTVIRNGNSQVEKTNGGYFNILEWIDDCNYRIKYDESKMTLNAFQKKMNDDNGVLVKVNKIVGKYLYFDSFIPQDGKMIKISGKMYRQQLSQASLDAVIEQLVRVKNIFEERNSYITKVYGDLKAGNAIRDTNIVRLEKIKSLSFKIQKQTDESLVVLSNKLEKNDTVKIFKIGLKYLQTIKEIEPILPVLYRKMEDDIMGRTTIKNDTIILAGQKINDAGVIYKNLRDEYSKNNKLIK